jgi:uncharacterized membrane protein
MSNLFVLTFKDEKGAERMLHKVTELQKQELIVIDDAAIAVHHQDGKIKVKQIHSLAAAGALGGAFWGVLFGVLFFVPFAGMAVGAAAGALMSKLNDYGINDTFIKDVSRKVTQGTSALFLLVQRAQREKVVKALKPYGGELIQSSLSPAQEAALSKELATSAKS